MTTSRRVRGVPPGRAGLLWLRHRLAMAQRAAELLERKLRILRIELERLKLLEERTREAWSRENRAAQLWAERTLLLGGDRAVRLASPQAPATVTISVATSMGVRYPADAVCTPPEPDPAAGSLSNAALSLAVDCHRRALDAAVRHAAASAALRIVEAEQAATELRLRGLEERWIPRLQDTTSELVLGLEESEHADAVRLRWSDDQLSTGPTP
jgi:V/A-type H+-transporting ATPase subunit D